MSPAFRDRLPALVDRRVRAAAWAMLVAQSTIVFTGGVVRLTGSGLGCPEWPRCTEDSYVNTPEMGLHGFIEFGNRLLGVGLGILGVLTILLLWRLRRQRRDLFFMAVGLTAIVPVQALIGGITVWTGLNPWVVAAHFLPSAVAVAVSALFVRRTYDAGDRLGRRSAGLPRALLPAIGVLTAITVVLGVIATGAGPHAGDANTPRNGFDPALMSRLHAVPVWLLVACTVAFLVIAVARHDRTLIRAAALLLGAQLLQGTIGYIQYFTGLPEWLVSIHLIGSCVAIAATANLLDADVRRTPLAPARRAPDPVPA